MLIPRDTVGPARRWVEFDRTSTLKSCELPGAPLVTWNTPVPIQVGTILTEPIARTYRDACNDWVAKSQNFAPDLVGATGAYPVHADRSRSVPEL